ncbi:transcription initiation factor IIF subunit alpha RAP74 [Wolffia australiana]
MATSSIDLLLKPSCGGCGSTTDLYGSNCKHMTLCLSCGKTMAENRARCYECGATITNLIREYNVRASTSSDKSFSIGRFVTGVPPFSRKKSAENKWTLQKEGLQGRQMTDGLKDKFKNKPWLLEDETGQHQYSGQLEGTQTATYYLLMMQGKEFVATPAGSWYNFNKVAQYKQLTLEEAEEKMNKRKSNATGYERWMMKAATNGPAAFGEHNTDVLTSSKAEVSRPRKGKTDEDGNLSDKAEEDQEEEESRKSRLGLNKKGMEDDEDVTKGDFDLDDDDIERGDDWEHEEIFTDDDEAVGNDPEEREELAPEIPAPPEIKQDDDEEGEEEGGLSKSGKELKKLLGRTAGLEESEPEDEEDDDDDLDDDVGPPSPVLAPKQKDLPREEPSETTPSKPALSMASRGTPPSAKPSKSKRKLGDEVKPSVGGGTVKKIKTEAESRSLSAKEELASGSKPSAAAGAPVTEEEIRSALLVMSPVTTQDLVAKFKPRLRSSEDKKAFADILKRISKIQKTNGANYVVLRDK